MDLNKLLIPIESSLFSLERFSSTTSPQIASGPGTQQNNTALIPSSGQQTSSIQSGPKSLSRGVVGKDLGSDGIDLPSVKWGKIRKCDA
jgi:hypothetical protein